MDAQGVLTLDALAARPDGTKIVRKNGRAAAKDAEKLGLEVAEEIRREMPCDIFEG
jgi:porphobilinogen deaminase